MKNFIINLVLVLVLAAPFNFSQQTLAEKQLRGYNKPDELVTLSSNLSFSNAIDLLSKISEKTTGKPIVSTIQSASAIGVEINNMPYDKALTIIVQYAGLTYEIKQDVIIVKARTEQTQVAKDMQTYAEVGSREVKISAVFFEMDVNEAKQRGIDWKAVLSGRGVTLTGQVGQDPTKEASSNNSGSGSGSTNNNINEPMGVLKSASNFNIGNFATELTTAFKFFENENLGEIIASPNITVRDRNKGRIQVGSDFSIKQRDFSGNIIESFFSTGSIIEVVPYIYNEDSLDYCLLDVKVERSSFIPDQTTTEIRKTEANTQVLMFNGEETVLGGLYINDETKVRNGIPILKDLPWWVLGLRYIFGSEETRIVKKELVILIKAEMLPTLKERVRAEKVQDPIKNEVLKYRQELKVHQFEDQKNSTQKN